MINYYGKFFSNLSHTFAPLYQLLQKQRRRSWSTPQEEAFLATKKQLTAPCLLAHYNPEIGLTRSCDASPYGFAAVLSQETKEGTDRSVSFSSQSLSSTKRKYAQLEKEGLTIILAYRNSTYIYLVENSRSTLNISHCNTSFPNFTLSQQWHQQESRDGHRI